MAKPAKIFVDMRMDDILTVPVPQILYASKEFTGYSRRGSEYTYTVCTNDFELFQCGYFSPHERSITEDRWSIETFTRADGQYSQLKNSLQLADGFFVENTDREDKNKIREVTIHHANVDYYQGDRTTEGCFQGIILHAGTKSDQVETAGLASLDVYLARLIGAGYEPKVCTITRMEEAHAHGLIKAAPDLARRSSVAGLMALERRVQAAHELLAKRAVVTAEIPQLWGARSAAEANVIGLNGKRILRMDYSTLR